MVGVGRGNKASVVGNSTVGAGSDGQKGNEGLKSKVKLSWMFYSEQTISLEARI